jgi:hypothetical protein
MAGHSGNGGSSAGMKPASRQGEAPSLRSLRDPWTAPSWRFRVASTQVATMTVVMLATPRRGALTCAEVRHARVVERHGLAWGSPQSATATAPAATRSSAMSVIMSS